VSHPSLRSSNEQHPLTHIAASFDDGGFQADNATATSDDWAPDAAAGGEETGYLGQDVSKHDDGGCRK
jgi:hypothetical protein